MLTLDFVRDFTKEWIEAWNEHDLVRILSHYSDTIELSTPYIASMMNVPSGAIRGKEAAGMYWHAALKRVPGLHFTLIDVLVGVNSIVIYYDAVFGRKGAELMEFDASGKVCRSIAHYRD